VTVPAAPIGVKQPVPRDPAGSFARRSPSSAGVQPPPAASIPSDRPPARKAGARMPIPLFMRDRPMRGERKVSRRGTPKRAKNEHSRHAGSPPKGSRQALLGEPVISSSGALPLPTPAQPARRARFRPASRAAPNLHTTLALCLRHGVEIHTRSRLGRTHPLQPPEQDLRCAGIRDGALP
jgi:hypothetical protein